VRDCCMASWATLYRASPDEYGLRYDTRWPHRSSPEMLEMGAVLRLVEREELVRVWLPGEAALEGARLALTLPSELDARPTILLVGFLEGGEHPSYRFEMVAALAEVCAAGLRHAELLERLRSQVFIDIVTNCYNRRAFEEHLNVELVRARRYTRPLGLLLLDLDDFKRVNDAMGHPTGDYALQRIGETLRATFRTTDRVCRYGGDEFAVIFPETSRDDVLRLAERLRRQIARLFPDQVVPHPITASIGVAAYPGEGLRSEDLVRAADRALYASKAAGRNQVVPG
jgi:diguanylate cyclase (GGDEF)-like protein